MSNMSQATLPRRAAGPRTNVPSLRGAARPPAAYQFGSAVRQREHCRYMAYVLAFTAPLGTIPRIGSSGGSVGISTLCLVGIVVMRFPAAMQMLLAHRLLFWFAVFEAYLAFSSASRAFMPHPEELRLAYFNLANLVIYTMFAAGVASIGWNRETTSKLVRCLTLGVALSATMTAVDHLNLIDIPRVNERFAQSTFAGESIEQAYGPFSERTAMTVYLSLAVPLMLVMCGDPAEKRYRNLYLYSIIVASCSLLLSHNRAGPLAICLVCAWFFLRNRRQMQKLLLKAILAGTVILAIAVYVFPGILHAYMHMLALSPLGPLLELGIEETMETRRMFRESDGIRLLLFRAVLRTLADNPFGAGLANVYTDDFGWYDPHSIYTATLMSAGL